MYGVIEAGSYDSNRPQKYIISPQMEQAFINDKTSIEVLSWARHCNIYQLFITLDDAKSFIEKPLNRRATLDYYYSNRLHMCVIDLSTGKLMRLVTIEQKT